MTNIVEKLRSMGYMPCIEAADEIEQLRGSTAALQTENERLTKENIDRLMQKVKLEDEIQRLQSSPTDTETDELIERLLLIRTQLHTGAVGQREVWEEWLEQAAEALHRLARNQMSANYANLARVTALQTQEADAATRHANEQQQRAERAEHQRDMLTEALIKSMALQDALLTDLSHLQREQGAPPNLQILAAKHGFDIAMKKLLGDPLSKDTAGS